MEKKKKKIIIWLKKIKIQDNFILCFFIYIALEVLYMNIYSATAKISGSETYPDIYGIVCFKQEEKGVNVEAEIFNLPKGGICAGGVFGFHIHEGNMCSGDEKDPFADAKGHYNPKKCPHPYHSGDLPPLFENQGYARMSVLTDKFTVEEIIGKTIIIHNMPDDFTSQPAGNAGQKIACGIIMSE